MEGREPHSISAKLADCASPVQVDAVALTARRMAKPAGPPLATPARESRSPGGRKVSASSTAATCAKCSNVSAGYLLVCFRASARLITAGTRWTAPPGSPVCVCAVSGGAVRCDPRRCRSQGPQHPTIRHSGDVAKLDEGISAGYPEVDPEHRRSSNRWDSRPVRAGGFSIFFVIDVIASRSLIESTSGSYSQSCGILLLCSGHGIETDQQ